MTGYGVFAIVALILIALTFFALWRARRDLRDVEREVRRWKHDIDDPPPPPDE
jgi:hypothetical protein